MFNTLNSAIHNFPGLGWIAGCAIGVVPATIVTHEVMKKTDNNVIASAGLGISVGALVAFPVAKALIQRNINPELIASIMSACK